MNITEIKNTTLKGVVYFTATVYSLCFLLSCLFFLKALSIAFSRGIDFTAGQILMVFILPINLVFVAYLAVMSSLKILKTSAYTRWLALHFVISTCILIGIAIKIWNGVLRGASWF